MLDSFHPRAGIVTVYRKSYMLDTPSQVCVTISGCPGWETASSVLWERLPQLAVAAFFKENDCEGEVVYTTDLSRASGSHAFNLGPVGAVIRSLMVLENSQLSPFITSQFTTSIFPITLGRTTMAVAGITTVDGTSLWFDASTSVCDTFDNCGGWGPATRISWRAVPTGVSVRYYKGEDCNNGDLVFFTDPGVASGTTVLPKKSGGHQIRSIMAVGPNNHPTRGLVAECFYDLAAYMEHLKASNNSSGVNYADSSNWLEPLHD